MCFIQIAMNAYETVFYTSVWDRSPKNPALISRRTSLVVEPDSRSIDKNLTTTVPPSVLRVSLRKSELTVTSGQDWMAWTVCVFFLLHDRIRSLTFAELGSSFSAEEAPKTSGPADGSLQPLILSQGIVVYSFIHTKRSVLTSLREGDENLKPSLLTK
jgi:hypothetical protein